MSGRGPYAVVRFDDAATIAIALAEEISAGSRWVTVVRDVLGRFSFVVDDTEELESEAIAEWTTAARERLGPYVTGAPVTPSSRLWLPEIQFSARTRRLGPEGSGLIHLLDNTVVGADWSRATSSTAISSAAPRLALYGFKGGVGRSTATAMLASAFADEGECVLVVDLDLESPGAAPLLAPDVPLPRYGIVDHLVEDAVGNADGLDLVVRTNSLPAYGDGQVWLAPARGSDPMPPAEYHYVDKLNRVYGDLPSRDFAGRLAAAISAAEAAVEDLGGIRPTVVLLDTRAGIHDIAAAVISRIADLTFLFAADTAQTWQGYRDLFVSWRNAGEATDIREKLRTVASMVPSSGHATVSEDYLDGLRESAYDAFRVLYDDVTADGIDDPTAFNPAETDLDAPHYPIPIVHSIDLVGFRPETPDWVRQSLIRTAFEPFLETATGLVRSMRNGAEHS